MSTMGAMSSRPELHTSGRASTLGSGRPHVEFEFQRLTIPRDFSRTFVTRLLVERAENGGWEIHRLRVLHDGTRKVELRRKIIRQQRHRLALA
jgi:hypothetical protein